MKKGLLLAIAMLSTLIASAQKIERFVSNQLQTYPKSRLLDIYKSCFQDYMGAEHLVSDRQSVKAYLDEELATTSLDDLMPWYYEPCGPDSCYYRVSIRAIKEGLITEDALLDAFIRSACAETRPSVDSWSERWHKIMGTFEQTRIVMPRFQEDKQFIDSILAIGKYAISHSPEYRNTYHPHYRIVERSIFEKEIRPLLPMASTVTPPQQERSAVNLKNVMVTARAVEKSVSPERTRINLAASMSSATGSVLEVLRSSSAVTIDGSAQVSIRGNSNVLILVDGVPTTLDGLGGIPAANVQSIDIVTSPDAKYDAEGSGGIISIVSKKQTPEAFTAMASANYGINNFVNGNVAMSYNFGRWGIRVNYNGKWERDHVESELHRRIAQTGSTLDQMIDAAKKTTGHNIGLNMSFKATTHDVLTLDVKAGFPRMNNLQTMNNHYGNAGIVSEKLRQTDIAFNREMLEGSLGYKHLFEPGRKELSIMASLSGINGHRPSYYYEQSGAASALEMVQRSESGGRPRIAALQLDYMAPLGRGKLETGVKMTYRRNNIDHKMYEHDAATDTWLLSVPLSNDLRHREYIPAAYAMYSSKLTGQLSLKAGLRLEYSRVTLQSDKDQLDEASNCYFVAPNLVLNYRVSEPWQLSLGLSRRISRPTYPQLNPYVNLIDNQTYETGNVRLKPEKANKLDLGYSYTGQTLKVSGNAYLNYTQDYINQIAYLDKDILVMTYVNGDMDLKTGIEHNIRWSALRWLGIDLGSNIFYTRSRADWNGTSIRNQGWTTNTSATLNIMPLRGMTIQAQYFVTTPQYFPQFTTKTIHYCNLGIRQQLPKASLTISALVTDVFNTRRWDISSDNTVYTLTNRSRNRSRVFWLGLTWNFHSYKPLGSQKKQEEDRSVIRLGE